MKEQKLGIEDFRRICKENYEKLLSQNPKYEKVREMIEKMLGCGKKENGYMEYVCPRCQKKKSVLEFIKRLVQHILPKGFQRVRYFGLHATCLREKIAETLCKALGAVSQLASFLERLFLANFLGGLNCLLNSVLILSNVTIVVKNCYFGRFGLLLIG